MIRRAGALGSCEVLGAEVPAAGLRRDGVVSAPAWPCCRPGSAPRLWLSLFSVAQRLAHIGDVDRCEEAGVAGDRQVTVMPGRHDLGRIAMLVVVVMAGRVVITAWTRTSLRSFPSAMARAMSASVMRPAGWPVCSSVTMRAVVPACFIRYAAAATWSYCPAVVSGGRIRSVTVAAAARG